MNTTIESGKGDGYSAGVTSTNRLLIEGDVLTQFQQEVLNGNGYNFSTGVINLTSANESGLWYFESQEELPIVFKEILIILGGSTGGTGAALVKIYRNPSAGTLVDSGTSFDMQNRDFSSAKQLTSTNSKGAEGSTITASAGTFAVSSRTNFDEPVAFDAEIIVLRKGNSIAVSWQPPSGNTSQDVVIAGTVILETADI